MVKKHWVLAVALAALSACAQQPPPAAPPDTSADEAKLKADNAKWMDDFNAGNIDAVVAKYASDAIAMPPNMPAATGRDAIKTAMTAMATEMKGAGLTLKSTATTGVGVSGDLAWMSGTYAITDASGATVDVGKYLSVHRKTNGTWEYVRDIWNSDNPPPPPAKPGK